jgi:hypothetical protein
MSDLPPPLPKEPQKEKSPVGKVLFTIGSFLLIVLTISFSRGCDTVRRQEAQRERASMVTTVWVPSPLGRMRPYQDAEVLRSSTGYIKFRTWDGMVIEHSGEYQIQTAPRR